MNKTILSITFVLLFAVAGNIYAQQYPIKPLQKGSIVPDILLTISIGGDSKSSYSACLKDLKEEIIIFDFWGVHCLSCIVAMPHMLELQEQFAGKLKVILVTSDSESDIQKLWVKYRNKPSGTKWVKAGQQLHFIANDTILKKIFPHTSQPTHVWINRDKVFISKSAGITTTAGNINNLLSGKPIKLREFDFLEFDLNKPDFWFDERVKENLASYSFFAPYLNVEVSNISKTIIDEVSKKPIGINCFNSSILELYSIAYRRWISTFLLKRDGVPNNRIISKNIKDTKLKSPESQELYFDWRDNNSYCYALKVPASLADRIEDIMRKDLDKFFNIDSKIEVRPVKCIILKENASFNNLVTKSMNKPSKVIYDEEHKMLVLVNVKMALLSDYYLSNLLHAQFPMLPFINEIKFMGNIDVNLSWDSVQKNISFEDLKIELKKYGLELTEEYRNIEMLIMEGG